DDSGPVRVVGDRRVEDRMDDQAARRARINARRSRLHDDGRIENHLAREARILHSRDYVHASRQSQDDDCEDLTKPACTETSNNDRSHNARPSRWRGCKTLCAFRDDVGCLVQSTAYCKKIPYRASCAPPPPTASGARLASASPRVTRRRRTSRESSAG